VTTSLGVFAEDHADLMMIAYTSFFSGLVMLGQLKEFESRRLLGNAFLVSGSLGVVILLLTLSFRWYWDEVNDDSAAGLMEPEMLVLSCLTLVAIALLAHLVRLKGWKEVNSKSYAFLVVILLYFIGWSSPTTSQVLVNLLILFVAVHTIQDGAQQNHLGILNYGLVIISLLIGCRFFDTNFSFVIRGLLFIIIGAGFFIANYYMLQRRKKGT
jgi:hypothetical protein